MDWDVIIVGGGAAGIFASIQCRQETPSLRVLVLEKSPRFLTKVGISGGGRCNVTHACFDPRELAAHYPRGSRELRGPFSRWQPSDTVKWFEERGAKLKTEADGRVFPVTDSSRTIIDCLLGEAAKAGVVLRTRAAVTRFERGPNDEGYRVFTEDAVLTCRRLMVAVGGLREGGLSKSLEAVGHTIEPLAPSLFTFNIKDPQLAGLQGIAMDPVEVALVGHQLSNKGPVLITHWGLSGPGVLKLSAMGARVLQACGYRFEIRVNWLAGHSLAQLRKDCQRARKDRARQGVLKHPLWEIPKRFWERAGQLTGVTPSATWSHLPAGLERALIGQLTNATYSVEGKSMNKEEFVTCGGVSLKEVDFRTMQSRLSPGLFLGGEVLDIDGITGGFNLQAAWTGGYLAGRAMGKGEGR